MQAEYARLDALAVAEPQRVRLPSGATPAVAGRLRKNYALDRARYFIPCATKTTVGLGPTARLSAATVMHLSPLPPPDARTAAYLRRGGQRQPSTLVVQPRTHTALTVAEKLPAWSHMVRFVSQMHPAEWREFRAMAKRDAKFGKPTPEQRVYLTMQRELGEHIAALAEGGALAHPIGKMKVPRYPIGVEGETRSKKGRYYHQDGTLRQCTFEEYMMTKLHRNRSCFLVGDTGLGKTQLMMRCAIHFCQMYGADMFIHTKAIDSHGMLTKSGLLHEMGCILMSDFSVVSQGEVALCTGDRKSLVDCAEGGAIAARWARVQFRPKVPRMFSVQSVEWFYDQNLACLGDVARDRLHALMARQPVTLPDELAICRRAVIFQFDAPIISEAARQTLDEDDDAAVAAGLRRLQALG